MYDGRILLMLQGRKKFINFYRCISAYAQFYFITVLSISFNLLYLIKTESIVLLIFESLSFPRGSIDVYDRIYNSTQALAVLRYSRLHPGDNERATEASDAARNDYEGRGETLAYGSGFRGGRARGSLCATRTGGSVFFLLRTVCDTLPTTPALIAAALCLPLPRRPVLTTSHLV